MKYYFNCPLSSSLTFSLFCTSSPNTFVQKNSNKFGISLTYSHFGLRPKILTLGKTQINLAVLSLIRIFAANKTFKTRQNRKFRETNIILHTALTIIVVFQKKRRKLSI